eukprot:jgi/Tetstr1/466212/TSEL_010770.t1
MVPTRLDVRGPTRIAKAAADSAPGDACLLSTASSLPVRDPETHRPAVRRRLLVMPRCVLGIPGVCPSSKTLLQSRLPGGCLGAEAEADAEWGDPAAGYTSSGGQATFECVACLRRTAFVCVVHGEAASGDREEVSVVLMSRDPGEASAPWMPYGLCRVEDAVTARPFLTRPLPREAESRALDVLSQHAFDRSPAALSAPLRPAVFRVIALRANAGAPRDDQPSFEDGVLTLQEAAQLYQGIALSTGLLNKFALPRPFLRLSEEVNAATQAAAAAFGAVPPPPPASGGAISSSTLIAGAYSTLEPPPGGEEACRRLDPEVLSALKAMTAACMEAWLSRHQECLQGMVRELKSEKEAVLEVLRLGPAYDTTDCLGTTGHVAKVKREKHEQTQASLKRKFLEHTFNTSRAAKK